MVTSVSRSGVIGHPIRHSPSPLIHGRWFERFGIRGQYDRIDGEDAAGFRRIVRQCAEDGWVGLNVTLPFKPLALEIADTVSPLAKRLQASNLLVFRDGAIHADNTDAPGFQNALVGSGHAFGRKAARVLGAGGAAPAILWALEDLGVEEITLCNRTDTKAIDLAARFERVRPLPWDERNTDVVHLDLVVNATALGMVGQPPLPFNIGNLRQDATVVDIITTPLETPLLGVARAYGQFGMNGVPMLVHQAAPSFQAWFGIDPSPDVPDTIRYIEQVMGDAS